MCLPNYYVYCIVYRRYIPYCLYVYSIQTTYYIYKLRPAVWMILVTRVMLYYSLYWLCFAYIYQENHSSLVLFVVSLWEALRGRVGNDGMHLPWHICFLLKGWTTHSPPNSAFSAKWDMVLVTYTELNSQSVCVFIVPIDMTIKLHAQA